MPGKIHQAQGQPGHGREVQMVHEIPGSVVVGVVHESGAGEHDRGVTRIPKTGVVAQAHFRPDMTLKRRRPQPGGRGSSWRQPGGP
jgi:hypothetical protein